LIRLNIVILVGAQERLPVRLVALRLPAPLAAQRRRRARANARRDRALRLTKRYLKLLDWTILLTNVTPSQLSAQQPLEAYSCRWQIEVLFKTWKSHFQLGRLPSCNPLWVQIQLLVKLLAIALLQSTFAPNPFVAELRALSPLKIAAYFSRLLPLITASPHRDWFEHFLIFAATILAPIELTSSKNCPPYVQGLRPEVAKELRFQPWVPATQECALKVARE
jgi:hypothetical protein